MKSNLQIAINREAIYCAISIKTNFPWRDFILQKGHIYGYSPELKRNGLSGLFVVYQVQKDDIIIRIARYDELEKKYSWEKYAITKQCDTGRIICDVNRMRIGSVELPKYDITSFYKPRLVTDPFVPMPYMRIPMGNRGKQLITSNSRTNNLTAESSREFLQKRRDRRLENVMHTLDVRVHRAERARNCSLDAIRIAE